MKRIFSCSLAFAALAAVYACSSDSDTPADPGPDAAAPDTSTGTPDTGNGDPDTGTGTDAGDEAAVPTGSPIEGIAAPAVVLDFQGAEFLDGPTWHSGENALYFTRPLGVNPDILKMPPAGQTSTPVRTEAQFQGPIGTTVDKTGAIVIAEGNKVVRIAPDGGAPEVLMTEADAGGAGAAVLTPNDVVARLSDNTLYVTDPGYFAGDPPATNRLYRIAPDGGPSVAIDYGANVPRPNGIALAKDEKTLYVSFTQPPQGQVPHIMKYPVNTDGSLGAGQKFVDIGADTTPDGLAIDEAGNVYVAIKTGVAVYKADGSAKWGDIPIPQTPTPNPATGVAFGGADKKTLYITTAGGKIFSVAVKVAGVAQ